jgi:hypothetical protein
VYDNDGERTEQIRGDGGRGHIPNFLKACRSRNVADLACDVEQGHLSAVMLHTGNISYRIGKPASVAQVDQRVSHQEESRENWEQMKSHLHDNGVDLDVEKPTLGPWLTYDPQNERFIGEHAADANELVKEVYRDPYVIPDVV